MKTTNKIIQLVKQVIFAGLIAFSLFSCDNDDSTIPNDDNQNQELGLIGIRSTNMPSGNSCNIWDLIKSPAMVFPIFDIYNTATVVDDIGLEYLGQTTMSYQSSAYDRVNKKYAVSTSERVIVYNAETNSIEVIHEDADGIMAMEFIDGVLYVKKANNIHTMALVTGTLSTELATISSSGIPSNMAFNGDNIHFIQKGRLYTFNTDTNVLSQVAVTSENVVYNGVEYHLGYIYAAKRYVGATEDDFVRIDVGTGAEEILFSLGGSYSKDYSRISSALDYTTTIYYLASSNGHSTDQHIVTTINISDAVPTPSSDTTTDNKYVFGLQLKD